MYHEQYHLCQRQCGLQILHAWHVGYACMDRHMMLMTPSVKMIMSWFVGLATISFLALEEFYILRDSRIIKTFFYLFEG